MSTSIAGQPWLVIVDMQNIFGDSRSAWFTPRFAEIVPRIRQIMMQRRPQICLTRFLAPKRPQGSWIPYYQQWSFALQPSESRDYQLVKEFSQEDGLHIDATTFSKWTPALARSISTDNPLWLTGVSTDCCVLSTALAAADDGRQVKVIADACAGVDDIAHTRALDVMRLYFPLIEVVTTSDLLRDAGVEK